MADTMSYPKKGSPPTNAFARFGEKLFHVHARRSTWLAELR